jgi:hypothetical protein
MPAHNFIAIDTAVAGIKRLRKQAIRSEAATLHRGDDTVNIHDSLVLTLGFRFD